MRLRPQISFLKDFMVASPGDRFVFFRHTPSSPNETNQHPSLFAVWSNPVERHSSRTNDDSRNPQALRWWLHHPDSRPTADSGYAQALRWRSDHTDSWATTDSRYAQAVRWWLHHPDSSPNPSTCNRDTGSKTVTESLVAPVRKRGRSFVGTVF